MQTMKKLGLCSLDDDFTREYANTHGKNYIVFSEMVFEFIKENIATIKPKNPKDLFLPTIKHIQNTVHDTLLLDMEVLMHDVAVKELKKSYKLVYLKNAMPKSTVAQMMVDDYKMRLEKICEEVI